MICECKCGEVDVRRIAAVSGCRGRAGSARIAGAVCNFDAASGDTERAAASAVEARAAASAADARSVESAGGNNRTATNDNRTAVDPRTATEGLSGALAT